MFLQKNVKVKQRFSSFYNEKLIECLKNLEISLYLSKIGKSCLRYIVSNEAILQYFLNKEKFVEATKQIILPKKEQ